MRRVVPQCLSNILVGSREITATEIFFGVVAELDRSGMRFAAVECDRLAGARCERGEEKTQSQDEGELSHARVVACQDEIQQDRDNASPTRPSTTQRLSEAN